MLLLFELHGLVKKEVFGSVQRVVHNWDRRAFEDKLVFVRIDPALLVDVDDYHPKHYSLEHLEPSQLPESTLAVVGQLVEVFDVPFVQLVSLKVRVRLN